MTQDEAKKLFEYRDGKLYWKIDFLRHKVKGKIAGSTSTGRARLTYNKKDYLVHRIIYLMHYGFMPEKIDHKDRNPLNNSIDNLRPCTDNENGYNSKRRHNKETNIKNVVKIKGKYRVGLKVNGNAKYFGTYESLELAELVSIEARNKYHGEYANHD